MLLLGCESQTDMMKDERETTGREIGSKYEIRQECYAYYKNNDTILLQFENNQGKVTGNMKYDFFQKDGSEGSVTGEMKGNIIFAVYRFQAEGTESQREIAFKPVNDGYVVGYGPMEMKDSVMVFTDPDHLEYDSNFILEKRNCR